MDASKRSSFQGISNIVRFNWHFYLMVGVLVTGLLVLRFILPIYMHFYLYLGIAMAFLIMMVSLLVSWYVYDLSELYEFHWLNRLPVAERASIWNIHAGFDESSSFLQARYPQATFRTMDFYNPKKHTEVSIKRARKAYPPHPAAISIDTENFENQWEATDWIFLLMSAHEIQNRKERIRFFEHLQRALQPEGRVVVMEHLRDLPNFLAYTLGCFHFHTKKTWLKTFRQAGLVVEEEWKETPFISIFILCKYGTTS